MRRASRDLVADASLHLRSSGVQDVWEPVEHDDRFEAVADIDELLGQLPA